MRSVNAACLAVLLASSLAAVDRDEFHWRSHLAPGLTLEIKGVNGDVRAEAASGGQVEVYATKRGRYSEPADVDIRVVEHDGGITICAVYPTRGLQGQNQCRPGNGGGVSLVNNDVRVDFHVRVPKQVRFVGRTVNGAVEAESLGSAVEAYTVNGGIRISTASFATARTVNGSIRARLGSTDWRSHLDFHTVNGGIALELPRNASTDVLAQTVNGRIHTDFALNVRSRWMGKHLSGTLGRGGRELTLRTVNGGIEIRRAG